MTALEIAGKLGAVSRRVMMSDRFKPEGWEPPYPFSPLMNGLVELGLFVRRDGRCGFEAFKDSFVVPTPLGLEVRSLLKDNSDANG